MPRIRRYTLDGLTVEIASFSFDEAQKFMQEGVALRDSKDTTDKDWELRTLNAIVASLNKAAGKKEWSLDGEGETKKITAELDMVAIEEIFREVLKMSGLLRKTEGEALATSIGS